jgi:hypothetical protein
MPNLYKQFMDLQSPKPLRWDGRFVVNGVATIDLPGGGRLQARGPAQAGQRVFVRDGAIEGEAPSLTYAEGGVATKKERATWPGAVTPDQAPTCRTCLQAGKARSPSQSEASLPEF